MNISIKLQKAQERLKLIRSLKLEQPIENEIVEHLEQQIEILTELARANLKEKIYS